MAAVLVLAATLVLETTLALEAALTASLRTCGLTLSIKFQMVGRSVRGGCFFCSGSCRSFSRTYFQTQIYAQTLMIVNVILVNLFGVFNFTRNWFLRV